MDLESETPAERFSRFEREAVPLMGKLFGFAMQRTNNDVHAASDLLQMTYVRAFEKFHKYTPGTYLYAWMRTVMANLHATMYHAEKRRPDQLAGFVDTEDGELEPRELATEAEISAEMRALESMSDEEIMAALQDVPEDFRTPVVLADVEGYSYKEIADIMGTPVGTVMSRLHRGRRRLRQTLRHLAVERGYSVPRMQEGSET